MNSLLIVEGKSDKDIIEHLINFMSLNNIEMGNPICNIDKCELLDGTGELKKKLTALSRRVKKESISKVGIIFDADKVGISTRTNEIEKTIQIVFEGNHKIEFKIHILNIDGYGELEDILQKITSVPPIMANCLNTWQECLKDKKLDEKELNKLWLQVYQKYDCCTKDEQKNMRDNCNSKILLENKKIYDFDKDIKELNELKEFLQELGAN
ncbi:MAG: hypothetical protein KAH72_10370 [Flavobacteriaceae bacterium]|nr:hypothetical protein [Flavobacteriaceae bacterium]